MSKDKTITYVVLRDCYGFQNRYWKAGDTVELPQGTEPPSKHFHDITKPVPQDGLPKKPAITAEMVRRKSFAEQEAEEADQRRAGGAEMPKPAKPAPRRTRAAAGAGKPAPKPSASSPEGEPDDSSKSQLEGEAGEK